VKTDDWYYDAVKYVYENNIMQGTEDGFEPDKNMTRAMLVTVLYRMEKENGMYDESSFCDIEKGAWYYDAVNWAAENGIVSGMSENSFAPDKEITREQMATVFYRYTKFKGYNVDERSKTDVYNDGEKISEWALDAVSWANATGLISGTSETELSPDMSATRAQMATILMRFCEVLI